MTVIGTAGWSIGRDLTHCFAHEGSSLQRYASVLNGVEVNSSFYRRHKLQTWQRWADSVPDGFRFAVKMPKTISHELRLIDSEVAVTEFIADVAPLGHKLGPLLLQTPPSLEFDAQIAGHFFEQLRERYSGAVVVEPRHVSWAGATASSVLAAFGISRVAADPSLLELLAAAESDAFVYLRMHGAPRIYYSSYDSSAIERIGLRLAQQSLGDGWCIFDNTASGAALANALELRVALRALDGGSFAEAGNGAGRTA